MRRSAIAIALQLFYALTARAEGGVCSVTLLNDEDALEFSVQKKDDTVNCGNLDSIQKFHDAMKFSMGGQTPEKACRFGSVFWPVELRWGVGVSTWTTQDHLTISRVLKHFLENYLWSAQSQDDGIVFVATQLPAEKPPLGEPSDWEESLKASASCSASITLDFPDRTAHALFFDLDPKPYSVDEFLDVALAPGSAKHSLYAWVKMTATTKLDETHWETFCRSVQKVRQVAHFHRSSDGKDFTTYLYPRVEQKEGRLQVLRAMMLTSTSRPRTPSKAEPGRVPKSSVLSPSPPTSPLSTTKIDNVVENKKQAKVRFTVYGKEVAELFGEKPMTSELVELASTILRNPKTALDSDKIKFKSFSIRYLESLDKETKTVVKCQLGAFNFIGKSMKILMEYMLDLVTKVEAQSDESIVVHMGSDLVQAGVTLGLPKDIDRYLKVPLNSDLHTRSATSSSSVKVMGSRELLKYCSGEGVPFENFHESFKELNLDDNVQWEYRDDHSVASLGMLENVNVRVRFQGGLRGAYFFVKVHDLIETGKIRPTKTQTAKAKRVQSTQLTKRPQTSKTKRAQSAGFKKRNQSRMSFTKQSELHGKSVRQAKTSSKAIME